MSESARIDLGAAPTAQFAAACFAAVARRLDERAATLRVAVTAPAGVTLDLDRAGRIVIRIPGQRPRPLDLRRRWIADHPVPLSLRGQVLVFRPVDAGRFRVSQHLCARLARIVL